MPAANALVHIAKVSEPIMRFIKHPQISVRAHQSHRKHIYAPKIAFFSAAWTRKELKME